MRSFVFCIFLAACGGASTSQNTVTLTPAPSAAPVSATTAPPPTASATATAPSPPGIRFEGGDGSAQATAIVIRGAHGESDGVAAEYKYLADRYGARGTGYQVDQQSLLSGSGHSFDRLDVTLKNGTKLAVYFDITEYFGKF